MGSVCHRLLLSSQYFWQTYILCWQFREFTKHPSSWEKIGSGNLLRIAAFGAAEPEVSGAALQSPQGPGAAPRAPPRAAGPASWASLHGNVSGKVSERCSACHWNTPLPRKPHREGIVCRQALPDVWLLSPYLVIYGSSLNLFLILSIFSPSQIFFSFSQKKGKIPGYHTANRLGYFPNGKQLSCFYQSGSVWCLRCHAARWGYLNGQAYSCSPGVFLCLLLARRLWRKRSFTGHISEWGLAPPGLSPWT